jgi:hypothetical protein
MKVLSFAVTLVLLFCSVPLVQAQATTKKTGPSAKKVGSLAACRDLVLEKSEFDHKDGALQGISEVCVLIEPLQRPFQPAPVAVNMNEIKKAIEQKCRSNGLRIADGHNWKTPVLDVQLSSLSGPKNGQVAYIMTVELNEITILARDMKTRILSRLYSYERLECTGELHASQEEIQKDLIDCVDHFIFEWRHDNGRLR